VKHDERNRSEFAPDLLDLYAIIKKHMPSTTPGIGLLTFGICLMAGLDSQAQPPLQAPPSSIWAGEIGNGFQRGAQILTLEAGRSYGVSAFGGREEHHLTLGCVSYGHMLTGVVGENHCSSLPRRPT